MKTRYRILFLALILLVAGVFRFWQLDRVPPGLYPDEAVNGLDAIETLRTGDVKVFYPDNNGREGLFFWLIALSFKIFGVSIWSMRLVSAFCGTLTVLGLYLLARELAMSYRAALFSSFLLAVSFWHTNFSRISFRAIMVPLLLCFSFYFLLRAFRTKQTFSFVLAGIFFGLGFYTYIAFRAAVVILAILLIPKIKQNPKGAALFLLVALLTALPIGIYFLNHPQDFIGRASNVSIFNSLSPITAFFMSLGKTLAMFHFYGDPNWRHNLAGSPMLHPLIGALFALGLILALSAFRRPPHVFLLVWFAVMLLPAVTTTEGLPHALRVIGVIPAVYLLVGLGFDWLIEKISFLGRKTTLLLLVLFLLSPMISNFNKYFFIWGQNPQTAKSFNQELVALTDYLAQLPTQIKKYLIINEQDPYGLPMSVKTIAFETISKKAEIKFLAPGDSQTRAQLQPGPSAFALLREDAQLLDLISRLLPNGEVKKVAGFTIYETD